MKVRLTVAALATLNLLQQTGIVTLGAFVIGLSPLGVLQVSRGRDPKPAAEALFLLGTGSMTGLCFFHILPELWSMGNLKSKLFMLCVLGLYALLHARAHHHHHDHGCQHCHAHPPARAPGMIKLSSPWDWFTAGAFSISIYLHALADGMFLGAASSLGATFAGQVFLALLVHKAYEALSVSASVVAREPSRRRFLSFYVLYSLLFPLGVLLVSGLRSRWPGFEFEKVGVYLVSASFATLLGCLVFDFLLPSYERLRRQPPAALWLGVGLFLSFVFTRLADFD